ncbi:hypothetical protein IMCC3317_11010 [Kordia antarctica]|uniref:Uncharacterized protein n=1 Tax=Kordia antarctica TaxID=1218801 RepID=A0A7L4ZGB2_9FLAO|nr:hypothetical protein [Kordia antarctica]QHI35753.1 hypothetical protein IMCC3317_11010 [Kordia antarctica]
MSQLGNPLAKAVVTKGASKAGDFLKNNTLVVVGTLATVYAWYKLPAYLKRLAAERYARANIGHPVVTAAAIIHESFSRIGYKDGFLSFLLPEFDIFTDEAALMDIASQIDDVKLVAQAYKILFDRDLFKDTLNGLSTTELSSFYNAIRSPSHNSDPQLDSNYYLVGDILYCAKKSGIQVPQVELQNDDSWLTTQELYGNYNHKQEIGQVVATDIYAPENKRYYIVERCSIWGGFWCYYGIVWSDQVINQEI